ncbi:hypothetical protein N9I00_01510 [bacterium]|nr:hypothetical protein [bacterium]
MAHLIVTTDYSVTYCNNCGAGSHCGTRKYTQFKDYKCDGGELREVITCSHCNCKKCKGKITQKKT